jgi:hypothetical protein
MKYRCVICHCNLLFVPGLELYTATVTATVKFNRVVKHKSEDLDRKHD